jgi:hypothetical protein
MLLSENSIGLNKEGGISRQNSIETIKRNENMKSNYKF